MELRVEVAGLEPALSTQAGSQSAPTWYGGSPLPYTYFIQFSRKNIYIYLYLPLISHL